MNLNNFITYIVNLKKHPKRKANIVRELKRQGIKNFKVIEAIDGYRIKKSEIKKIIYKNHRGINKWNSKMSKGQLGCALSHLKIYKLILKDRFDVALILEDDAIFKKKLNKKLQEFILKNFSRKPQVTLISEIKEFYKNSIIKKNQYSIVDVTNAFFTHAYFINKSAAKKILKFNFPIKTVADNFIFFKIYCNILLKGLNPFLVTQDKKNFLSSIDYKKYSKSKRGFLFKFRAFKITNSIKKFLFSCFDGHLK